MPGAFEIPLAAQGLRRGRAGRRRHRPRLRDPGRDHPLRDVAGQCAAGIQRAQLDTGVPIVFGVLTTEDLDQALARSEDAGGHNVGEEGAATAVEMALLLRRIRGEDLAADRGRARSRAGETCHLLVAVTADAPLRPERRSHQTQGQRLGAEALGTSAGAGAMRGAARGRAPRRRRAAASGVARARRPRAVLRRADDGAGLDGDVALRRLPAVADVGGTRSATSAGGPVPTRPSRSACGSPGDSPPTRTTPATSIAVRSSPAPTPWARSCIVGLILRWWSRSAVGLRRPATLVSDRRAVVLAGVDADRRVHASLGAASSPGVPRAARRRRCSSPRSGSPRRAGASHRSASACHPDPPGHHPDHQHLGEPGPVDRSGAVHRGRGA